MTVELDFGSVKVRPEIFELKEPSDDQLNEIESFITDDKTFLENVDLGDTVSLYMRDVYKKPLLTIEEERKLTKTMAYGRSFVNNDDAHFENMRLSEDSREAFNKLVDRNLRLVINEAKNFQHRGLEFSDLIAEGNLGLITGVSKYDPSRGVKLNTYATWWVRQSILRAIYNKGREIRLPVGKIGEITKLHKIEESLYYRFGRDATDEEISKEIGYSVKKIKDLRKYAKNPVSLDREVLKAERHQDHFGVIKAKQDVEEDVGKNVLKNKIREALQTLPPREENILKLRFGMTDGTKYTLEQVGQKYGLTRERVRQIQNMAFDKLKITLGDYEEFFGKNGNGRRE